MHKIINDLLDSLETFTKGCALKFSMYMVANKYRTRYTTTQKKYFSLVGSSKEDVWLKYYDHMLLIYS